MVFLFRRGQKFGGIMLELVLNMGEVYNKECTDVLYEMIIAGDERFRDVYVVGMFYDDFKMTRWKRL